MNQPVEVPLELSQTDQTELREILARIDLAELRLLVKDHCGWDSLDANVATVGTMRVIADSVVVVANTRDDWRQGLLRGMLSYWPNHSGLRTIAGAHGVTPPPAAEGQGFVAIVRPADSLRRVRSLLEERSDWLRYLRGYKQMHDSLDRLGLCLPSLRTWIETNPGRLPEPRFLTRLSTELRVPCLQAVEGSEGVEFPENHREWIEQWKQAIETLRNCAAGKGDLLTFVEAADILQTLPDQQQRGLNRELVNCARRLKLEELLPSLDETLPALESPGQPPGPAQLVRDFRDLCRELQSHVLVHDLSQGIDKVLLDAQTTSDLARQRLLLERGTLRARMQRLADAHPPDETLASAIAAADAFLVSSAEGKPAARDDFSDLQTYFRLFFVAVDRQLLATVNDLVGRALQMGAFLGAGP